MVNQKIAKEFVRRLGPGLITGAADDDPSGIATYSQAGSQFRFALVWTLLLTTPLMIGIQMLSARIGWLGDWRGSGRQHQQDVSTLADQNPGGFAGRCEHHQHRR